MYVCKTCGKEVFELFGSGIFCSRSCANTRKHSEETKRKISESNKGKPATSGAFKSGHGGIGDRKAAAEKTKLTWEIKKQNRSYDQLSIREKVLFDQDNKCNVCGITDWQGKPITLELHHIDGNHNNNNRDNIEALCPNCHSQTASWRVGHKSATQNQ